MQETPIDIWFGTGDGMYEGPIKGVLLEEYEDGMSLIRITDRKHLEWLRLDPFEYECRKMTPEDQYVGYDDYAWSPKVDQA